MTITVPEPKQDFYETQIPEVGCHRSREDAITRLMRDNDLSYPDAEGLVDNGELSLGQWEVVFWRTSGVVYP